MIKSPDVKAAAGSPGFSLFYFSDNDNPASQDDYRLYLEGAKAADALGFTAVWTPERHFTSVGAASPNPAVLASALAMVTDRIALRAGSVVAPLHHPLRIAEEWAIVDRLSKGRVGLSFASGWVQDDFVFAPDAYKERVEVMLKAVGEVRALWRGEALPYRNGAGEIADIRIRPRPVRAELQVWLTAARSRETFETAGRIGANVLTAMLQLSAEQLAEYIPAYRAAREAAGHDPATGQVAVMLHTFVTDDAEAAIAAAKPSLRSYFRSQTALRESVHRSSGRNLEGGEKYMERIIDFSVDKYLAEKALIGSPETCRPLVEKLHALGADEIACLIDFGVDADEVLAALPALDRLRRLGAAPALETVG